MSSIYLFTSLYFWFSRASSDRTRSEYVAAGVCIFLLRLASGPTVFWVARQGKAVPANTVLCVAQRACVIVIVEVRYGLGQALPASIGHSSSRQGTATGQCGCRFKFKIKTNDLKSQKVKVDRCMLSFCCFFQDGLSPSRCTMKRSVFKPRPTIDSSWNSIRMVTWWVRDHSLLW